MSGGRGLFFCGCTIETYTISVMWGISYHKGKHKIAVAAQSAASVVLQRLRTNPACRNGSTKAVIDSKALHPQYVLMHITECIGCSQENPVESFQRQVHEIKLKSMPMKPQSLRLHPTL